VVDHDLVRNGFRGSVPLWSWRRLRYANSNTPVGAAGAADLEDVTTFNGPGEYFQAVRVVPLGDSVKRDDLPVERVVFVNFLHFGNVLVEVGYKVVKLSSKIRVYTV